MTKVTHPFSVQVEQCPTPQAVAHEHGAKPHEHNEEDKVTVIVVTNTIEYPR